MRKNNKCMNNKCNERFFILKYLTYFTYTLTQCSSYTYNKYDQWSLIKCTKLILIIKEKNKCKLPSKMGTNFEKFLNKHMKFV